METPAYESDDPEEYATTIRNMISELEPLHDDGAPIDLVYERSKEAGFDTKQIKDGIDHLRHQSEIYEPSTDHFRTT